MGSVEYLLFIIYYLSLHSPFFMDIWKICLYFLGRLFDGGFFSCSQSWFFSSTLLVLAKFYLNQGGGGSVMGGLCKPKLRINTCTVLFLVAYKERRKRERGSREQQVELRDSDLWEKEREIESQLSHSPHLPPSTLFLRSIPYCTK